MQLGTGEIHVHACTCTCTCTMYKLTKEWEKKMNMSLLSPCMYMYMYISFIHVARIKLTISECFTHMWGKISLTLHYSIILLPIQILYEPLIYMYGYMYNTCIHWLHSCFHSRFHINSQSKISITSIWFKSFSIKINRNETHMTTVHCLKTHTCVHIRVCIRLHVHAFV